MKCSDLQDRVSQYADGSLCEPEAFAVEDHLTICPLCRERVDNIREMLADMKRFSRPEVPVKVANRVRLAVRDDIRKRHFPGLSPSRVDWLQMRLMPISVGIMASLFVSFSFLTLLLSGSLAIDDYHAMKGGGDSRIMITPGGPVEQGKRGDDISPVDFARTRTSVSGESPSINPQGALASISRSLVGRGIRNNEVVVVADVFSNGLARIAEVVEPSQNSRAINELQKALDSDLSAAPFVPAEMDNRSNSVRVVLKFQSVEVRGKSSSNRR
jgi:hypothetical protein